MDEEELSYEGVCNAMDMIAQLKSTLVTLYNGLPKGHGKNCIGDAMCDYDEAYGHYKEIKERMEKENGECPKCSSGIKPSDAVIDSYICQNEKCGIYIKKDEVVNLKESGG